MIQSVLYGYCSAFGWIGEIAHHNVDLAGGNSHDDPLDGADFFVCNLLFPGHAKVMLDSWLTLPGHGGSQPYHRCRTGIDVLFVANSVVEVTVGFMLFGGQHYFVHASCCFVKGVFTVVYVTN
jgi:hypothetical protein